MTRGLSGALPALVGLGLLGALAVSALPHALAQASSPVGEKVTLGPWAIDRTEVTIGQFERYARATGTVTRVMMISE